MSIPARQRGALRGVLPPVPLLAGLPQPDLDRMAAVACRRTMLPGARLVIGADDDTGVYLIRRGFLKTTRDSGDGVEVILAIHGAGDLLGTIGPPAEAAHERRFGCAIAMGEVDLLVFPRAAFLACLAAMPVLSFNLLALYADRLDHAGDHIESLATADVEERLLRLLHHLARAHGEPTLHGMRLPYRLTQADLASMIGASRVRVNQILGALRKAGVVTVAEGRFVVATARPA
jgi:CRP/FNR family transcriptional regulator, cyclic AMP receptor protein